MSTLLFEASIGRAPSGMAWVGMMKRGSPSTGVHVFEASTGQSAGSSLGVASHAARASSRGTQRQGIAAFNTSAARRVNGGKRMRRKPEPDMS